MRTLSSFNRWLAGTFFVLLTTCSVYAQSPAASPSASQLANGSIHIVAVMVEFQEDDNRFTSGNGTFNPDFLNREGITIDPLPHDRGYFEAHLLFAKNYFERVSGNQLEITYEVLPEIVTVPEEMAAYSPLGEDGAENFKLANFARDVWEEVDRQNLLEGRDLDPDRTMYIAFHAGVGRDLELIGTTLFKTPQDIPSVYLSQNSFRRLLENPVFDGFNVNGNIIRNTAILPETQSRPGENIIGEEFVIELSINGILTATIGSFLGLPDLFNTETGASGIGRFGLMDGAGFFSYFGLFPPEPSAWEKAYLGWVTPFDITSEVANNATVTVTAPTSLAPGTVARLPISTDEYFLVENRIRDPFETGLELTIRRPDGVLETVTIPRDETRFSHNNLSDIGEIVPPGVLVDVNHFDWSLPGLLDIGEDRQAGTDDDRFLNGGILIWHIDEQIIRSTIDDNAINNNPQRKGVKLVEADAAQDIGRPAGGVTQYDQGAPFDFWWAGNDFTVITQTGQRIVLYENRFGDDTRPNNRSNSGARTYFEFLNFSDNQIDATFDTRTVAGQTDIRPVQLPVSNAGRETGQLSADGMPLSVSTLSIGPDTLLIVPLPDGLQSVNLSTGDTQFIGAAGGITQPLIYPNGLILGGEMARNFEWNAASGQFNLLWEQTAVTKPRVVSRSVELSGVIELAGTPFTLNLSTGDIAQTRTGTFQSSSINGLAASGSIRENLIYNADNQAIFTIRDREIEADRLYLASLSGGEPAELTYLLITNERFVFMDARNGDILTEMDAAEFGWPALFDWSDDGFVDIMYVNHSTGAVEARNRFGAMLSGFPFELADDQRFTGTPLIAASTQENLLIVPSTDEFSYSLQVYNQENLNQAVEVLLIGPARDGLNLIQPILYEGQIYAVAPAGDIRKWSLGPDFNQATSYVYSSPTHNLFGLTTAGFAIQPQSTLIVGSETYNWPNPASGETNLRFMTSQEADVTLSIISYGGQLRYESSHSTRGNQPQEVFLDTSSWSNGVYFVRVTARSQGKTEHKVITMVVAR